MRERQRLNCISRLPPPHKRPDIRFCQYGVTRFRFFKQRIAEPSVWLNSSSLKPVPHIRQPTHATDLDFLFTAEHSGRNAGVDSVGEIGVPLSQGFDDRCRVDSRRSPEGVPDGERVVVRNRNSCRPSRSFDIVDQSAYVVWPVASQSAVENDLIERSIAHPFPDTKRASVDSGEAEIDRELRQR
jgi:hypothetical protein